MPPARLPGQEAYVTGFVTAPQIVFNRPVASDYRLSPALTARLLGTTLVVSAALVLLATLAVAIWDLHWLVIAIPLLLVVGAVAATAVLASGFVVRLSEEGYQVRRIRGAGTAAARWRDVEDAVTTHRHGLPCVMLRLKDGRSTTIPVTALNADPDTFALDVRDHLNRSHGIRPL